MLCGILWDRVECLLDYLDEVFSLHPLPTELESARSLGVAAVVLAVISSSSPPPPSSSWSSSSSSRRRHRRVLDDQKGLSRGILDIFCSCPNGTLRTAKQPHLRIPNCARRREDRVARGGMRSSKVTRPALNGGRTTKSSIPLSLPAAGSPGELGSRARPQEPRPRSLISASGRYVRSRWGSRNWRLTCGARGPFSQTNALTFTGK